MSVELQMSNHLTATIAARTATETARGDAEARAAKDVARELPITRIVAASGWQPINVAELWKFRELLYFLTWRDVKVRYKQTALGLAWAILQPLMMMVIFAIVFGRMVGVDTGEIPYKPFSYLGLVPWTFFATAIANAGNSVVGSERLVTKIYFPRLSIPFASVGAAVVDFLLAFALGIGMMLFYGIMPGIQILLLPVVLLVILLLAAGVGTLLAALNVKYRDFRYVIPFMIQLWLFGTPSLYMKVEAALRGKYGLLVALNPMTWLVATFRDCCTGKPIHWGQFGLAALFSSLVFLAGCFYFRRTEQKFADII
jgi:lipopolysaccharide transport system permease protein